MALEAPGLMPFREGRVAGWTSGAGPALVCVAGPPASALLFRHLAAPLNAEGWQLRALELFHPPGRPSRPVDIARRLAPGVPEGAVLLSHGLAHPVAWELARSGRVRGLVLLDGPLGSGAVARTAARLARVAGGWVPTGLVLAGLRSSVMLRRTVTNPYAMDRDIVAMLAAPNLATAAHRRSVLEYLHTSANYFDHAPAIDVPVLLVWSASNLPFPVPGRPRDVLDAPEIRVKIMEGAGFMSVEERPWAIARSVLEWTRTPQVGGTATSMS